MRRFILFLLPVILIFVFCSSAFADTPNKDITVVEGAFEVVFFDTVKFSTTDKEANITTKAISSDGWLDWENAHLRVWGSAGASNDVNVFILGGSSLDLTYMSKTYTQTAFDDLGSATPGAWWAFRDTLKQAPSAGGNVTWFVDPCAQERFKVIQFDGQSGNPAAQIMYWYLVVPKKPGAPTRNAYGIFSTT